MCLLRGVLVQLGTLAPSIFSPDFVSLPSSDPLLQQQQAVSAQVLRLLAYMVGLWLWGLSLWFFLVSVGSLWKYLRPESKGKLRFQMTWFSFVFPNTALVRPILSLCGARDGMLMDAA